MAMTDPKPSKESRRSSRHRHDSTLEILGATGGASVGVARLVDVSAGGASFVTTAVFVRGASLRGRIRLLGAGVLEFAGRIVRVKEKTNSTLYAVEFETVRGAKDA